MSVATDSDWLGDLLRSTLAAEQSAPESLKALRARALERANALRLPTVRDEEWRFTDLAPLYKGSYPRAASAIAFDAAVVDRIALADSSARLVFCDGHYIAGISNLSTLPADVTVTRSHEALGSLAAIDDDLFAALNTCNFSDAAVIDIARDADCPAPIHVMFVSHQTDAASYPRVLIRAATGARVVVLEEHVSSSDGSALVNAVTEIDVAPGATVRHCKLQRQATTQFHFGLISARIGRDATLVSQSITLGARLSRANIHITQAGEGAHCQLDGLAVLGGRQHADTHSTMDHALPHGTSEQLHKCIVDGGARTVFNGKIKVSPHAQLTSAAQQSRNLLLSDRARVDTKPQLEIYTDDVKCAHGATVGQLESDELFYLRSRGLSKDAARALLTYGFAAEVIERIAMPSVAKRLRDEVLTRIGEPA